MTLTLTLTLTPSSLQVQTVVNFDFPATSSLYLHRAGRTARMGATGRVISLVHSSQRRFAESLMMAVRDRSELHLVRKGDKREAEWRAKVARYGGGGGGLARARQTLATAGERLNRIQRSKRSGAARLNRAGGQPGSGRGYGRG